MNYLSSLVDGRTDDHAMVLRAAVLVSIGGMGECRTIVIADIHCRRQTVNVQRCDAHSHLPLTRVPWEMVLTTWGHCTKRLWLVRSSETNRWLTFPFTATSGNEGG